MQFRASILYFNNIYTPPYNTCKMYRICMKQMPHFPRIPRIPATNQTPRHKSRYAIRGTPYGNSRARNRRSHLEEEGREGVAQYLRHCSNVL